MTEPGNDTDAKADLLQQALDDFKRCEQAHSDNRRDFEEDVKFARLGEQWDEGLKLKRQREGRPCLTINKLPPFIRQVVNDARQNKPSIKVLPQDSGADPETADILSGLIRNIETSSDADVAYDTALDNAATGGFGFFRINLAYAHDGSFDQDIVFERIANPLTVYPDPDSEAADSSDWNVCFVTRLYTKGQFERMFPDATAVDFAAQEWPSGWCVDDKVQVAEYWVREPAPRQIVLLSSGEVVDLSDFEKNAELYAGVTIVGEPREVEDWKVTQHILNGVEVLSSNEWAGKFIPIVPVYGEEVFCEGKRHLRSLTRDARDAQVMYNAWRTASTELVAMAPKTPWIGPEGAFDTDQAKWDTANSASHAYITYKGNIPPQRQPFAGVPPGALQEALNASDDMKSIIGIYDAGIGARSNETSGRAIMARQKESDTSTFHFIDNLSRAIRHAGRIMIDLIPKVYTPGRMIRILGEDGKPANVAVGSQEDAQAAQQQAAEQQQQSQQRQTAMRGIYALGAGTYDLTVAAGPSFNTRREEAAVQMTEFIRAYPQAASLIGDLLVESLDWPKAAEIAKRLQTFMAQQQQAQGPQAPPQDPAKMAQLQLKAQEQQTKAELEGQKLQIDGYEAETSRMKVVHDMQQPTRLPQMPRQQF